MSRGSRSAPARSRSGPRKRRAGRRGPAATPQGGVARPSRRRCGALPACVLFSTTCANRTQLSRLALPFRLAATIDREDAMFKWPRPVAALLVAGAVGIGPTAGHAEDMDVIVALPDRK